MFPVYVCYDDGVAMAERAAIERGLIEIEPLIGSDTKIQICGFGGEKHGEK